MSKRPAAAAEMSRPEALLPTIAIYNILPAPVVNKE